MQPFTLLTGTAIPFARDNVDTDLIIPAAYLKATTRQGMGQGAFAALRYASDGSLDPACVFNQSAYVQAPILLTGANFGCGSSREHAAWALAELGIRCVIASSFADIFASNAFKNGILTVALPQAQIDVLLMRAKEGPLSVDLETQSVTTLHQDRFAFDYDPFKKHCLLNGLDEIGLTLEHDALIARFEEEHFSQKLWLMPQAKEKI
jgi:3-isopropylmalate/(R)-2-methylmalate dehydratase small subunit